MTSAHTFEPGDRVYVTDPALARLRDVMRQATGTEPKPNHHGTVNEIWDDGDTILIYFDDGAGAPYPVDQVRHLDTADTDKGQVPADIVDELERAQAVRDAFYSHFPKQQ